MSRRFLVAVDNSENAEWALNYALSAMDKHLDHLHLITVRDPESAAVYTMHVPYTYDIVGKVNEEEVQRCKKLLRGFARKAHLVGITTPLSMTIGRGDVGEVVCSYITDHQIDFLVMGRRGGLGALKRLILGSSSKYCIENADCNVVIVKHPFGPEEVHEASKEAIIAAEEAEREWRIMEYEKKKEREAKEQEEESKKDLELVKKLEEEERERREKEEKHHGRSVSGRGD